MSNATDLIGVRNYIQSLSQEDLATALAAAICNIDDEHLEHAFSMMPPEDVDAVRRALPLPEDPLADPEKLADNLRRGPGLSDFWR